MIATWNVLKAQKKLKIITFQPLLWTDALLFGMTKQKTIAKNVHLSLF
jgi:hypothetical protein